MRKGRKNELLRDFAILYKIPHSTFSDRFRGIPSHHEVQQKWQAISPAVERSLIRWVGDMDAREIAGVETTSLRSKYAGRKAGAGPGGRKKLIKGKIGDWELLKQMEMSQRRSWAGGATLCRGAPITPGHPQAHL